MNEDLKQRVRDRYQTLFASYRYKLEAALNSYAALIHEWMRWQGFWESENKGEKIALMHSELSECLEAVRKADPKGEVEELADAMIRIMDYCAHFDLNLGDAIAEKMAKNLERPRKHGKEF